MYDLTVIHKGVHNLELFEIGWAFNVSQGKPELLKTLLPPQEMQVPTSGPLKPVSREKTERLHKAQTNGH